MHVTASPNVFLKNIANTDLRRTFTILAARKLLFFKLVYCIVYQWYIALSQYVTFSCT